MDKLRFGTAGIPTCTKGDTLQGIEDVRKLNLDAKLITDMDSAMYAHRLSFHPDNINVARSALGLGSASLSQIARAMADAGLEEASRIEHDPSYHMPPLRELSSGEITLSR